MLTSSVRLSWPWGPVAVLLLGGCAGAPVQPSSPLVGRAAPPLQATVLGGAGPASLADAAGKVVIVDFWATYCAPCREALPAYQRIADAHRPEVAVIAVSTDEPGEVKRADIVSFARDLGVRFPVLWDSGERSVHRYQPPAMPTSYLIDRNGVVRYVHPGFGPGEAAAIERQVTALLDEQPGPGP